MQIPTPELLELFTQIQDDMRADLARALRELADRIESGQDLREKSNGH